MSTEVSEGHRLFPAWRWALNYVERETGLDLRDTVKLRETDRTLSGDPLCIALATSCCLNGFALHTIDIMKWAVDEAKKGGYYRAWVEEVLLHELAHVVEYTLTHTRDPDRKHGRRWQVIARHLGCRPHGGSTTYQRIAATRKRRKRRR